VPEAPSTRKVLVKAQSRMRGSSAAGVVMCWHGSVVAAIVASGTAASCAHCRHGVSVSDKRLSATKPVAVVPAITPLASVGTGPERCDKK
jgi:hypothetical protein